MLLVYEMKFQSPKIFMHEQNYYWCRCQSFLSWTLGSVSFGDVIAHLGEKGSIFLIGLI